MNVVITHYDRSGLYRWKLQRPGKRVVLSSIAGYDSYLECLDDVRELFGTEVEVEFVQR